METTTLSHQPGEPAADVTNSVAEPEGIATSRTAVLLVITAVAFFVIGYGVAWFSFNAATSAQAAAFQATVRQAVSEALADADLAATAPPEDTQPTVVNVSIDDDPVLGPEDAPITIVEFSDFRCPYCARFHAQTLYPLFDLYEGQIRLVYRDFPVVGGEQAAMAAECADDQGVFWDYHDLLFENQQALSSVDALVELASGLDIDMTAFQSCVEARTYASEVSSDYADGLSYGVRGTPAFFINGRPIVGAQPLPAFQQVIDEILAEQAAG